MNNVSEKPIMGHNGTSIEPKSTVSKPITGREGASIELKTASEWTANYRIMQPNETISHLFGRAILEQILGQEGCMGIRIYYSNSLHPNGWQRFFLWVSNFFRKTIGNAEGVKHFIIAGVAATGADQLPNSNGQPQPMMMKTMAFSSSDSLPGDDGSSYVIGEQSMPCPGSAGCPKNTLTGG